MNIVEARPLPQHRLFLRFGNGRSGEVDLSSLKFIGVYEPLRDPEFFAQVSVNLDWGTVVWPNGADMDPDVLYSDATGAPPPVGNRADTAPPTATPRAKLRAAASVKRGPPGRRPQAPKTAARKEAARDGSARNRPFRQASRTP